MRSQKSSRPWDDQHVPGADVRRMKDCFIGHGNTRRFCTAPTATSLHKARYGVNAIGPVMQHSNLTVIALAKVAASLDSRRWYCSMSDRSTLSTCHTVYRAHSIRSIL